MITAIVPAAGQSRRMGQPKLLLPLGPRTVIEHVLQALADSTIDQTVVVVRGDDAPLIRTISRFPVAIARLDAETPDMRASVLTGLEWAESHAASGLEAFLLAPADQPTIRAETIDTLIDRFRQSRPAICVPTFAGRRGHPVLFAAPLVPEARNLGPGDGLNKLLAAHAAEVCECPVDSPTVLDDLDTPADYERLLSKPPAPTRDQNIPNFK